MKIKIISVIAIFTFLICVCTGIALPIVNKRLTINKHLVLGSLDYVKNIQDIAKKAGNQKALSTVMNDVDIHGNDLDHNDSNDILRFHKLVSSLINRIGYVDMKTHYFRNKLNRVPKSLKALVRLNKKLPINKRWILLSIGNSNYHIQGTDGEYNLKFLSPDRFCEAVYNKKGVLLNEKNDPINMGTYNYSPGIPGIYAHSKFDVAPYIKWGNTPNSIQKGKIAINEGVHLAMMNYKKNAASVYLYRENLFGMQNGRVA